MIASPTSPPVKVSRLAMDRRAIPRRLLISSENFCPPSRPSFTDTDNSYMAHNFVKIRQLGEGDFGVVHEVICKFSSSKFAIKVSKVDKMKVKTGLNYTRMNLKEVRAHSAIPPHPHLVHFHQAWKEGGHVFMQIELCKESLHDYWMRVNKMSLFELHDVLEDSLKALKHLSLHNLVHLDIKPANILRTGKGTYKLADFSVTIDLRKDFSSDDVEIGTGRYAAPELLRDKNFTPKADIYSLAISISQVAVPAGEPLDDKEWRKLKEGMMPGRVEQALAGELGVKIKSMLRTHTSRPSADDLLPAKLIDPLSVFEESKWENELARGTVMCGRLSLSACNERELRENRSPLVRTSQGVIFYTDPKFFEMERQIRPRASLGMSRIPRLDLDD